MKYFFLYFILFLAWEGIAQKRILFMEEFNSNKRSWPLIYTYADAIMIAEGKLKWTHKSDKPWSIVKKSSSLRMDQDFELSTKIERTSGGEFGFSWAQKDLNNACHFTIRGYTFRIFDSQNGGWTIHKEYTSSSFIQPASNLLQIKKKGAVVTYLINGNTVFEEPYKKHKGNGFGYCAWESGTFSVDYLEVRQEPEDIPLMPGIDYNFFPQRLSGEINTSFDEMVPRVSADGKILYFSVRGSPLNTGSLKDDIYTSLQDNAGNWRKATNIGAPFNNQDYNYVCSTFPDANDLLLANTYEEKGKNSNGLSMAFHREGSWSYPVPLYIKNYYNLSSVSESCMSADRKVLLLTLKRKDTHGGNDIYVSFMRDGIWSEPENIGKIVNTSEEEISPFLAADGVTLYFSSRGHKGYGDADLFMTKRLDATWKKWSKPVNLGPTINTEGFEGYLSVPWVGPYAYYSGTEDNLDIFRIVLPEAFMPGHTCLLTGTVQDAGSGLPLAAEIEVSTENEKSVKGYAEGRSGIYQLMLPAGKMYEVTISSRGYHSLRENTSVDSIYCSGKKYEDKFLAPLRAGDTLKLANVLFYKGTDSLLPGSGQELETILVLLMNNPSLSIEIAGHTDGQGDPDLNRRLSLQRANAVSAYFISKGVNKQRIVCSGYGGEKPLASNESEEGRKRNRRVEFIILHR
jgi:outer membrane protein OmpA-like peptidoglycan-associated protein